MPLIEYQRIQEKNASKKGINQTIWRKKNVKNETKTLKRQAEIRRIVRAISHMDIETEIACMPQLLQDLGFANTSEFTLNTIPDDYAYLTELFE